MAERQHGVVSRGQLRSLGLGARGIDHRVSVGRLRFLHRGVYAAGHAPLAREAVWMAGVLAAGDHAVLSHRSAAALWGLVPTPAGPVDVTTPRKRHARPGLRLHAGTVADDERTVHGPIPVTTVPRTLLDLAAVLPRRRLERAVNEAEVLRLADPLPLADLLDRHRGRRGARALRDAAAASTAPALTRSELERRFASFIAKFDLPPPSTNATLLGLEVDALWPEQRLVVELDSRTFHDTPRAFEDDRARDRALVAAGYRVVRVTWGQLRDEPAAVARDLGDALVPWNP